MTSILEMYAEAIRRLLAQKRFLMLVGVTTGSLATLTFLSESFAYTVGEVLAIGVQRTSLLLLLISFISFSLLYLQSGGTPSASSQSDANEGLTGLNHDISARLIALEENSRELRTALDLGGGGAVLSAGDKEQILKAVVENTGETAIAALFDERIKSIADDFKRSLTLEHITSSSRQLIMRLR